MCGWDFDRILYIIPHLSALKKHLWNTYLRTIYGYIPDTSNCKIMEGNNMQINNMQ